MRQVNASSLADRVAVALGAVLLGLFVLSTDAPPGDVTHPLDAWAGLLLVAAVAVLAWGRRYPASVAFLLLLLSIAWYTRYTSRLVDVPTMVGFYLLGTTGDRVRQLAVAGVAAVAVLAGAGATDLGFAAQSVGFTIAAVLTGELVRSRRLLLEEHEARAERRLADERLRIARDVHDVLAHTVSVMTVQAGVAADAVDRDPDQARAALATLRSAGKDAMAEVRATVALLRGADAPVETAPAPGLGRVRELVDGARARGLDVELTMDVEGMEVESLVELTAYRVVQEGLTNVVRHSGAAHAAVRVGRGPGELVVEVVDDGHAAAGGRTTTGAGTTDGAGTGAAGGFGLRGMGERVEALGGELAYGPLPGRGWVVRATLPSREAGR